MMPATAAEGLSLGMLLDGFAPVDSANDPEITGMSLDSRHIRPGDVFIAMRGASAHGAEFIHDAVRARAAAVVVDADDPVLHAMVPIARVPRLAQAVGSIASRFYGFPSHELDVIAVTGTNGKTTVACLIAEALQALRGASGYAGTLGYGLYGSLRPTVNTTPDPVTLQAFFAEVLAQGGTAAAIELSSHGIAQQRATGTAIDVAVFTNLGHDHLDFHGSVDDYAATKKSLFRYPGLRHAVVNIDDACGREIVAAANPAIRYSTCSVDARTKADFRLVDQKQHGSRTRLSFSTPDGDVDLETSLLGAFNFENLQSALAALMAIGVPAVEAAAALSRVTGVAGRMQRVSAGDDDEPLVVVDYAHTPDSLEQALAALRAVTRGRLVCVFGCGGDRDRTKREPMGRVAQDGSDEVVITNDNPRTERPAQIIDQILTGMRSPAAARAIEDRRAAIATAIESVGTDDTVLIAGKGHETFQEIGKQRESFSDAEVALEALRRRHP